MSGFSGFFHNAVRSFTSFFGFVFDLMGNGLRFLCLTVRSHSALSAEVLLLRKQLAFYEERETQPRRLTNSARLSLVLWSHLFDWKSALVIVKPETLIGWHRNPQASSSSDETVFVQGDKSWVRFTVMWGAALSPYIITLKLPP